MKKIAFALLFCLVAAAVPLQAQTGWTGTYSTSFGNITLTEEYGSDYPGGGIIYGDYAKTGTIVGKLTNNREYFEGYFHNGEQHGKFIFRRDDATNQTAINAFSGFWGFGEMNNNNSTNKNFKWTGTKSSTTPPTTNVTGVWSGKWVTTFGDIILEQVGNKITGKYRSTDKIEAIYNAQTKTAKGTFANGTHTGSLEFKINGNDFIGKWGWGTQLNEGEWNGNKKIKTNSGGTNSSGNTSTNQQQLQQPTNPTPASNEIIKIRIRATYVNTASNSILTNPGLYGFAGIQVSKVTSNATAEVTSFGNKSFYLFQTTDAKPLSEDKKAFSLPDQPTYYRDYHISKSDWDNQNIVFEAKLFHHIRTKEKAQLNLDCGYKSITFRLKDVALNKTIKLPNTDTRVCYMNFIVEKL